MQLKDITKTHSKLIFLAEELSLCSLTQGCLCQMPKLQEICKTKRPKRPKNRTDIIKPEYSSAKMWLIMFIIMAVLNTYKLIKYKNNLMLVGVSNSKDLHLCRLWHSKTLEGNTY